MATAEQLRNQLWEKPWPTNRREFLEREAFKREIHKAAKHERMMMERAGYEVIANMKYTGGNNNGL